MFRNRSASAHSFAMIPRADIPRSSFIMQQTVKTSFDAGYLVPVMCEEVLPGDTFRVMATMFARLATPLFPVMDNLHLESFFFFVPCRLVWTNWKKFMGEQDNPADSISFVIPTVPLSSVQVTIGSLYDYFGIVGAGQLLGGNTISVNALPFRCYNLIWNQWFRDQNLQNSAVFGNGATVSSFDDGPDNNTNYVLKRRGKRHDYFTGCLPSPQKGSTAISLPMAGTAPVKTQSTATVTGAQQAMQVLTTAGAAPAAGVVWGGNAAGNLSQSAAAHVATAALYPSNLYADLSAATGATINALRQSFQIQKFLERDARGGTRYVEILKSHFGVMAPDFRLQRPEYLGGSKSPIVINPIAQTSATGLTGGSTPVGNLAAMGSGVHRTGFTQSFTEHGYVIGLVQVNADLAYQQGVRKMWWRSTRYDFYDPAFAMLGEQAVNNREIYCDGSASDSQVFGYQERWGEMRYMPSMITGLFRSTAASTIDPWHLAQKFTALPTLNDTFIQDTPPLSRILAVGSGANGQQLLLDAFFENRAARPMPMYSVPGLIDHF